MEPLEHTMMGCSKYTLCFGEFNTQTVVHEFFMNFVSGLSVEDQ